MKHIILSHTNGDRFSLCITFEVQICFISTSKVKPTLLIMLCILVNKKTRDVPEQDLQL